MALAGIFVEQTFLRSQTQTQTGLLRATQVDGPTETSKNKRVPATASDGLRSEVFFVGDPPPAKRSRESKTGRYDLTETVVKLF